MTTNKKPKTPKYAQNSMTPEHYRNQNVVQNSDFLQILEKTKICTRGLNMGNRGICKTERCMHGRLDHQVPTSYPV
jgi:hypothetical protein